jgi:two-component system, OmpR family, sensor histidine kinase MtrB
VTRGVTASWGGLAGRMRLVARDWPWGAGPRRWLSLLADRWRRSLQLRVVTATLVLSAVVVSVLGYALMQRFVTDLYSNKQKAAANVMQAGLNFASQNPQFRDLPGSSAPRLMCNLAKALTSGGSCGQSSATTGPGYGQGGAPYAVMVTLPKDLQGPTPDAPDPATGVYSGGEAVGFYGRPRLPASLVSAV